MAQESDPTRIPFVPGLKAISGTSKAHELIELNSWTNQMMGENNFESDDHQMEATANPRFETCLNSECRLQSDAPLTASISSFPWIQVAMEQYRDVSARATR